MRWLRAGDEQDAIETCALHRRLRDLDVSHVDRIEGATEDAHPHGWYSNSMSEIRTVSPGCTPSASSAVLTPSLSSSDWNRARAPSDSRSVRPTRYSTRLPRTKKPNGLRSTTNAAGPASRPGSLIFLARPCAITSGAEASALTIASISWGKPSPFRAEMKCTPFRRLRARRRCAASRSTLLTATRGGPNASSADAFSTPFRTAFIPYHRSGAEPSST